MAVDLAPDLLEILVCPNCHSTLAVDHDRSELVCTAPDCALAYPVRNQIPILLIDEARAPERRSHDSEGDEEPSTGESADEEPATEQREEPSESPEA